MTQLSKRFEAALAAVAMLAPDQQNLIALEVTQRALALSGPAPQARAMFPRKLGSTQGHRTRNCQPIGPLHKRSRLTAAKRTLYFLSGLVSCSSQGDSIFLVERITSGLTLRPG